MKVQQRNYQPKRRKNSANRKKRNNKINQIKQSIDKFESKLGGPKLESKEYEMIDFTEFNQE